MRNLSYMPAYKVQGPTWLNLVAEAFSTPKKRSTFHAYSPTMIEAIWEIAAMDNARAILVEPIHFEQTRDGEWFELAIS